MYTMVMYQRMLSTSIAYRYCSMLKQFVYYTNVTESASREIRALVIEMVLATDMSSHFQQLNSVKSMISGASGPDK